MTYIFRLLLFLSSYCSGGRSTGLATSLRIPEKASSRQAILFTEQSGVVEGNFAPSASLKFLSIFLHEGGEGLQMDRFGLK